MRRLTLAALCVAALVPCVPSPQHCQKDVRASAVDDGATIRDGRFDLTACEAKQMLLVEAWPLR